MLTLVSPLWLLGLLSVPLIRWLHRGGRHRRAVPVSRLALWRGAAVSSPAAGERRPPDPAWRRRALAAALFFLALAQPQWLRPQTAITLWVDDSMSMLTREAQGSRFDEGLALARARLAEVAPAEVEVRTLSDPWRNLGALGDATAAGIAAGAGRQEPHAPHVPPAALLRSDRLHWLLTDGAHAALLDWPDGRHADRVIPVGRVTRNVGLQRLSARRNPDDPAQADLLLKVVNGGTAAEARTVVFSGDAGELSRSAVELAPGATALLHAKAPPSARVRATLQPGDALAEDDEIVLDLAPLRRRAIAVDPGCPAALVAAVAVHPALAVVMPGAAAVDAALTCGTSGADRQVPLMRATADRAPTRPPGALQWVDSLNSAHRASIEAEGLPLAATLQTRPGDTVLLAIGSEPAIVQRGGAAKVIETALDFASMAPARGPEIPLLLNFVFERLLGGRLLDATAIIDRGLAASLVAPASATRAVAAAAGAAPAAADGSLAGMRSHSDGSLPILFAALLVLLWEIAALGLQWRRLAGVDAAGRA